MVPIEQTLNASPEQETVRKFKPAEEGKSEPHKVGIQLQGM